MAAILFVLVVRHPTRRPAASTCRGGRSRSPSRRPRCSSSTSTSATARCRCRSPRCRCRRPVPRPPSELMLACVLAPPRAAARPPARPDADGVQPCPVRARGRASVTVFSLLMPAWRGRSGGVGRDARRHADRHARRRGLIAVGMSVAEERWTVPQCARCSAPTASCDREHLPRAGRRRRLLADPRSAWLLLGPAIVMFLAYRAYTRSSRHAASSSSTTPRGPSRAPAVDAGLAGMLTMARDTFRAATVARSTSSPPTGRRCAPRYPTLIAAPAPDEGDVAGALRRPVGRTTGVSVARPRTAAVEQLLALLAGEPAAGRAPARRPRAARRRLHPATIFSGWIDARPPRRGGATSRTGSSRQGLRAARSLEVSWSTRPSTIRSPGSPTGCCSWTASRHALSPSRTEAPSACSYIDLDDFKDDQRHASATRPATSCCARRGGACAPDAARRRHALAARRRRVRGHGARS